MTDLQSLLPRQGLAPLQSLPRPDPSHADFSLVDRRNKPKEGQLHLRFQLPAVPGSSSISAAMAMASIQEVLSLPVQRLSPMPHMPSPFLGLMNRGNRIFWLVDLGALLGISRLAPNASQHNVVIVRSGAAALGLAVEQVQNMVWVTESQLHESPELPFELVAPYVSHSFSQGEESCWVLEAGKILQSPLFETL